MILVDFCIVVKYLAVIMRSPDRSKVTWRTLAPWPLISRVTRALLGSSGSVLGFEPAGTRARVVSVHGTSDCELLPSRLLCDGRAGDLAVDEDLTAAAAGDELNSTCLNIQDQG